jgi:hypothetical protein
MSYTLAEVPVGRIVTVASWMGGTFDAEVVETYADVKNGRPGLDIRVNDPGAPMRWCYLDQVVGVRVKMTK